MKPWFQSFGLSAPPFDKDINDEDLWLSTTKQEVLSTMVQTIEERGNILLIGDPGLGKTCVLRRLRTRLPEAKFRLTYCSNATLGRRDFYRQLCHAFHLTPKATAAAVFMALTQQIEVLAQEHIHPVFLLDEAHLLKQEVLDHLHVLTNYSWDQKPLLSLVLVGLPELKEQLVLRRNASLWSRIHTRIRLPEPSPQDTVEYIAHRLEKAGGQNRHLFAADTFALLHEASHGRLREIDRVASNALRLAAKRNIERVDRELVIEVIERSAEGRAS